MNTTILKTIVGSKAHNLAKPDSDTDFRSVYVQPTNEILSLGFNYKGTHWVEGLEQDNTAYEIGHFLMLALKNNPSILEVFVAPKVGEDVVIYPNVSHRTINVTQMVRELFKHVYDPQQAFNSFTGYSNSQRKKLLENHMGRRNKFACAYIRTLYNLLDLLETGTFSLPVTDRNRLVILKQLKYMEFHDGFVIDHAEELTERAKKLLDKASNKEYNPSIVNDVLLDIRKRYW